MLMVCAKSAAAMVLGGALIGQQADQNRNDANQDGAPPAPSIQADDDRSRASDQQRPENNADAQRQRQDTQQAVDNQTRQNQNIERRTDDQRQTFQTDDQRDAAQRNQAERDQAQQNQRNQQQFDQQGRAALGVTLSDDLRIRQVSPGSPAEQMGLRAGDEILSMNGQTFNSIDEFIQTVGATPQDQQIQIEIDRDGQRMTQAGQLAAWDRVHYSGSRMAGMGLQHQGYSSQGLQHQGYSDQGLQTHSAMRYPSDGVVQGGMAFDGQLAMDPCCDPCAGFGGHGGGFGYGGYGWGGAGYGWDGGWSRREARRAARRGYW
jgi:membrane-associated protease RseP (regulator of RpoE activity)